MNVQAQANELDNEIVFNSYKDVLNELNITIGDGAKIIGCSKRSLERGSETMFEPQSKIGEMALQLIRLYRSMFALAGGDHKFMLHLFNTKNLVIGKSPREAVFSIEGMILANQYYDAMRGKV